MGQGLGLGPGLDNFNPHLRNVFIHLLSFQFAEMTADVRGYVDQVLAETNLGYLNSGVPVRVAKFCLEQATVNDTSGTLALLNSFQVRLAPKDLVFGSVQSPRSA